MSGLAEVILFSIGAAIAATLLVAPVAVATAWLLARKQWRGKTLVETLVTLPLVVPPVATGVVLLNVFSRTGPIGSLLDRLFGAQIVFTPAAVVIAMMVMSFPLFVRTTRVAFSTVDPRFEQMARTLGAGEWRVFATITLPLAMRGVLGGALLAFARALGEFGATILVAGNIPGRTQTIALAIYNAVELGEDRAAVQLVLISIAIAFLAVLAGESLQPRERIR